MTCITLSRQGIATLASVAGLALFCLMTNACSDGTTPVNGTITRVDPPSGPDAMAPNLRADGEGALLTWLEPEGSGHALRVARLTAGQGWTAPETIAAGDQLFVNWADFPGVVRGPDESLIAHWLQRSGPDGHDYDVELTLAPALGATWSPLGSAHHDGIKTMHGFVSSTLAKDSVRLFWLDGRDLLARASGHMGALGHPGAPGEGAMTLETALVRNGAVSSGQRLDARVCDCCQTAAAMTADGPVVVYRDRSDAEIRDIAIIRLTSQGWTAPAPVHDDRWVVPGCPVNGPSVASEGPSGRHLVVAWFTAEGNRPRVQVAFSHDSGATFDSPLIIDDTAPLGRVSVILTGKDEAIVSWLARTVQDGAEIRLARARANGSVGAPLTVVATSSSRAAGFPGISSLGDGVLVVWTEAGHPSRVRAVRVPGSLVPTATGRATESTPQAGRATARAWDREIGSKVPDFAASTPEGQLYDLARMRGQVLFVNLWATWCVPCQVEVPELVALHERYAQRGLRIVGISVDVDRPPKEIRAVATEQKIPYLILHDPADRASGLFTGQQILPASFLFDRDGVLVWKRIGIIKKNDPDLAKMLEKILGGSEAGSRLPVVPH